MTQPITANRITVVPLLVGLVVSTAALACKEGPLGESSAALETADAGPAEAETTGDPDGGLVMCRNDLMTEPSRPASPPQRHPLRRVPAPDKAVLAAAIPVLPVQPSELPRPVSGAVLDVQRQYLEDSAELAQQYSGDELHRRRAERKDALFEALSSGGRAP